MKKTKQTKFPVARIKKIMQTDEDVGKVAMATPVLVSKALELFMASLVGAAAEETRAANSKKMTPYHLKRTILNTPMFDFLHEQVSSIPDPVASTSAPAAAKARGRKKKAPSTSASSGEDSSEDDYVRRPAAPARRPSAKKAKVEIPALPSAIPPLPTASHMPSVFAPPPPLPGSATYGLPTFTPGLPPVPGPSAAAGQYGSSGGVKREESESESGSDEDDE